MMREPDNDYAATLIDRLRHPDPGTRNRATTALAQLGRSAVPALLEALRDDHWCVRSHAAAALAEAPDPRAVPLLCDLLSDVDWAVRREAARALRGAADPRSAAALLRSLTDNYCLVRLFSAEALLAIQIKGGAALAAVWAELLPLLDRLLVDEDWQVRRSSAVLAGNSRDPRTIPALCHALGSPRPEVRLAVVDALGKIRSDEAVEPLRTALSDRDHRVQELAVRSLGEIGGEAAIPHLVSALESRHRHHRRVAAQMLQRRAQWRPTPRLRQAIAPLRRLLGPATRLAASGDYGIYRDALREIEGATASLSDLPTPAAASDAAELLPIPAEGERPASDPVCPPLATPSSGSYQAWWEGWLGWLCRRPANVPEE
jgi:HEAT repeat protein